MALKDKLVNLEDLKVVGDEVADLRGAVSESFAFGRSTDSTFMNTDAQVGASNLAKSKRWFINHTFKSGTKFSKMEFSYGKNVTTQRIVYVELWENDSGTLNKVKSVSVDVTAETAVQDQVFIATANLNYTVEKPALLCLCFDYEGSSGALLYTVDSTYQNRVLVSSNVTVSTDELAYSSLSEFTTVNINPSIKIYYSGHVGVNVVTIGEGMDYAEIQNALDAITDDTPDNPYTFLIMPKSTPYGRFSMIRKLTDPYAYTARVRNISLVGMDKAHCIIQSDTGDYATPPGEVLTNGIITNLTFVMTNANQSVSAEKGGYCLHIDTAPSNDTGYDMTIENCEFKDASGPCLGIGLRQDCTLTIRNCHLHTTLAANYAPHEGYRNLSSYGVLFAHTASGASVTGQNIIIENCIGICDEGSYSLELVHTGSYDQSTAEFNYGLINNVFWNMSANAAGYYIHSDLTAMPYNFGNNIPS